MNPNCFVHYNFWKKKFSKTIQQLEHNRIENVTFIDQARDSVG